MRVIVRRWSDVLASIGRRLDQPRVARWIVVAFVAGGLLVRAGFAVDTHFSIDLASAYATALRIAHGKEFPLVGGVTSWGGRLPFPGLYYMLAPPLVVSK